MICENNNKTIYIIDGYGFIFRAFYAVPNLTAKTGEQIGAVFGFFKMIISLINQAKPEYIVVALDTGKRTFRDKLIEDKNIQTICDIQEYKTAFEKLHISFEDIITLSAIDLIDKYNVNKETVNELCSKFKLNLLHPPKDLILLLMLGANKNDIEISYCKDKYKANRKETPDELKSQFKIVKELIDAMNIKTESAIGYEADDVIATLATKANNEGYKVIIVSADKDLCQLVKDGKIAVYDPSKKKFLDEQGVLEKFDVFPNQICDYLSIVGDHCDNVFGVNGIGPKGAVKLLKKYGNLENILLHLNELDEKTKQKFANSKDNLKLAHNLISLRYDAIEIDDFEQYKFQLNNQQLTQFVDKYGFKSIDYNQRVSGFRSKQQQAMQNNTSLFNKNIDSDNQDNIDVSTNKNLKQGSLF